MVHPQEGPPRIFVSSTIHDFRDLRSGLKFWLESLGYEVMLSELNDFRKAVDNNSYDACLRTIDQCEYFVLLIGARVGGLYDQTAGVSITRMEYQHAYKRLKEGKLKILTFVRKELWQVRDDRRDLADWLKQYEQQRMELTDEQIGRIVNHNSRFINDATSIFAFLEDVTRESEMKAAIRNGAELPKGNWVHVFDSFEDIALGLREALHLAGTLRRRGLVVGLQRECMANLRLLTRKNGGSVVLVNETSLCIWPCLTPNPKLFEYSQVKAGDLNTLILQLLDIDSASLRTRFLDEAIRSGEFLDYDSQRDECSVGHVQGCLLELSEAIEKLQRAQSNPEKKRVLYDHVTPGDSDAPVQIYNGNLMYLGAIHTHAASVVQCLVAAYRAVSGKPDFGRNLFLDPARHFALPSKSAPTIAELEEWATNLPPETTEEDG